MNLQEQFLIFINNEKLFFKKDRLLLAVSGGIDSMVLCNLIYKSGFNFSIAHCNFQLRGDESLKDAEIVRNIASTYNVKYYQKDFDTQDYILKNKVSIQVAAREIRYKWFDEIISENNYNKLLTAHHADDNVETILMNLAKGSGINGLRGILPVRGNLCRPLLFASKEQITDYAKANNLLWREDASNSSDKYTRNYFRNKLIPLLENSLPGFTKNMLANSTRFRDIEILYDASLERIFKKIIKKVNQEIHVPVERIKQLPANETIVYELVKDYGFTSNQLPFIMHLLVSDSGKFVESVTHRILRNRKWLIINPKQTEQPNNFIISNVTDEVLLPGKKLKVAKVSLPEVLQTDSNTALLDLNKIKFPLIVRRWKPGDYFYPLGMKRKKKLSRFFIDNKLSLTDKENVWVVESDKKIIWIAGYRIDDRFKIVPSTKAVLKFSLITE
ncbi:MAG: tRNA lysidine(34) synthetase TilS [Ferruginibacter sp.]